MIKFWLHATNCFFYFSPCIHGLIFEHELQERNENAGEPLRFLQNNKHVDTNTKITNSNQKFSNSDAKTKTLFPQSDNQNLDYSENFKSMFNFESVDSHHLHDKNKHKNKNLLTQEADDESSFLHLQPIGPQPHIPDWGSMPQQPVEQLTQIVFWPDTVIFCQVF